MPWGNRGQPLVATLIPEALRHWKLKRLSVLPKFQPFQTLADRLVSEENGKTAGEKGSCLLSSRKLKQHVPFQPVLSRCIDSRLCLLIVYFILLSRLSCLQSLFPPAFKASCCFPPCQKRQLLNTETLLVRWHHDVSRQRLSELWSMSAHSHPYADQVSPKIRASLRKYFGRHGAGGMNAPCVLFANCEQGISF